MSNLYIYMPYPAISEVNEIPVAASSEKEAYKKAFDSLTEAQKNNLSEMELVDVIEGVEVAQ